MLQVDGSSPSNAAAAAGAAATAAIYGGRVVRWGNPHGGAADCPSTRGAEACKDMSYSSYSFWQDLARTIHVC